MPRFKYSNITPFAKCPSCSRMIELKSFTDIVLEDSRTCLFCNTLIEKKEIISSCEKYLKATNGLRSGEELLGSYVLLPVVFALILLELGMTYFFDWGKYNVLFFLTLLFSLFCLLGGLLNTKYWLSQFDRFHDADEEFLAVRKKIRQAQILLVWMNIFNVIWWFTYIKYF